MCARSQDDEPTTIANAAAFNSALVILEQHFYHFMNRQIIALLATTFRDLQL